MTDELVEVAGGLYSKADAEKIEIWVLLAYNLLLFDHSKVDDLKCATRSLGAKAQAQYVQLESGDPVSLDVADLHSFLDGFPPPTPVAFVSITGDALFTCIDGPNAGAVVLCTMLDTMHEAITKGGET